MGIQPGKVTGCDSEQTLKRGPYRKLAALAAAISIALGTVIASAQPGTDLIDERRARPDPGGEGAPERPAVTLRQAVAMAQRQNPGRVVRAETKTRNGQRVHEIRILGEDGKVKTVRISANGERR